MNETKYLEHRKKHMRTLFALLQNRASINRAIRKTRKELDSWDRALLAE